MKKFDFRRQLKSMDLERLNDLRSYHLDIMLAYIGLNQRESDKHCRYVGYIDDAIKKRLIN